MIHASKILVSYIEKMPGHKDSKGKVAPYVIKSHETNKILSSFPSKSEAKQQLQNMHAHEG